MNFWKLGRWWFLFISCDCSARYITGEDNLWLVLSAVILMFSSNICMYRAMEKEKNNE